MFDRVKNAVRAFRSPPGTVIKNVVSAISFGSTFGDRNDPQWFQKGGDVGSSAEARSHAAVYSCVNILSQEVGKLRIDYFRDESDGSRIMLDGSAVARVLKNPNHYQTRSDFFLNMMSSLLYNGNAYAYAERNSNGTIIKLHPRNPTTVMPWVTETGEVYYSISKIDMDEAMLSNAPDKYFVPARDVLHIKLDTPDHPLIGVTPLTGCYYSISQGLGIQKSSTSFFNRMARPAGLLTTPNKLGKGTGERLAKAWGDAMSGSNAGKTAVLDNDLKWQSLTLSAADSQTIEQYQMTVADIAMVYRVPLYMLGDLTKSTYTNVEQMQKGFQAGALGFYTEHIEASLDEFFSVPTNNKVEFDMDRATIRTEFGTRIKSITAGIQGGLFTPNEGRKMEGLGPIDGGDEIYMQRQNVPLDMLGMDVAADFADTADGIGVEPGDNPPEDEDEDEMDKAAVESNIVQFPIQIKSRDYYYEA